LERIALSVEVYFRCDASCIPFLRSNTQRYRVSMLENIVLGVIANFLTDFIKRIIGISTHELPEPVCEIQNEPMKVSSVSIQQKREQNQKRRKAALLALGMAFTTGLFLAAATYLPLFAKSKSVIVNLNDTLVPLPCDVGLYQLTLIVVLVFYIPSFYVIQRMSEKLIAYVHNEWSAVDSDRAFRLFIACSIFWATIFSGALCVWLFPQLAIVEAFAIPILVVVVVCLYGFTNLPRR
jgi:FtsH-binding integral membrane protein